MKVIADAIQVSPVTVVGQQTHYGQSFPLVLRCQSPSVSLNATESWVRGTAAVLRQAAEHGTILFRGIRSRRRRTSTPSSTPSPSPTSPYDESLSNAVRVNKTPASLTANERRRT